MIYRTRPLIGVEYASRHASGFPQQKPPAAFFSGLDRPLGCGTQSGTHRAFLSKIRQLPLADSTGHWGTICKPVRIGLFSSKASSCLFGGPDRAPGCDMQAVGPGPSKSVPLCGTPHFFTLHFSLFTQNSPAAGSFLPAGLFYFLSPFLSFHIDIYLSMQYTLT